MMAYEVGYHQLSGASQFQVPPPCTSPHKSTKRRPRCQIGVHPALSEQRKYHRWYLFHTNGLNLHLDLVRFQILYINASKQILNISFMDAKRLCHCTTAGTLRFHKGYHNPFQTGNIQFLFIPNPNNDRHSGRAITLNANRNNKSVDQIMSGNHVGMGYHREES